MSLPKIVSPSGQALLERIRRKTHQEVVLHPVVKEQIEHLKDVKRWQADKNADEEYKTIIHTDLIHALRKCLIVQAEEMVDGSCWSTVVHGVSTDGIKLSVSVYLMKDNEEPLVIMSFSLLPDETEIGE